MQELRLLQERDLESIYSIYVHYVKKSTAIFDLVPDSFDVFKEHMVEISKTNPFYVALNDDVLIGYGYVHPAVQTLPHLTSLSSTLRMCRI